MGFVKQARMDTLPLCVFLHQIVRTFKLCALSAADRVRLAACSSVLHQNIFGSACHNVIEPILRERLKAACWSLLHAGYCVNVSDTLANSISCDDGYIRITYWSDRMCLMQIGDDIMETNSPSHLQIHQNDKKTFGEAFDKYIVHANARLQRSKRPAIRMRTVERHFARCADLYHASCLNGG